MSAHRRDGVGANSVQPAELCSCGCTCGAVQGARRGHAPAPGSWLAVRAARAGSEREVGRLQRYRGAPPTQKWKPGTEPSAGDAAIGVVGKEVRAPVDLAADRALERGEGGARGQGE